MSETQTLDPPESLSDDEVDQALTEGGPVKISVPAPPPVYGVRSDGTPRGKPGPKPGAKKSPGPRTSTPPRARSGPAKSVGPDYAAGFAGLLSLPTAALLLAGQRKPELQADAVALAIHTGPISEAVGQLARDQAAVAAVLDKLMAVGPYGALIAAVSPLVLQVMCNHGIIPAGTAGAVAPDQLVASFASAA